jgi:hypothetical protein
MTDQGNLQKAYFSFAEAGENGKTGGEIKRITFSFNPKEISIAKTAEWKAQTTKTPSMPQWVGTKPQSITVEVFLDASEGGDVSSDIDDLLKVMEPTDKNENDKPSPPFCSFGWGPTTFLSHAVIKTVAIKYTRFDQQGKPIRASAMVTLEELKPGTAKTNPTSGSPDAEVERIVNPGDSLASIAYEELGSPNLWRSVAAMNGIDDPFRIRPGTSLVIPSLTALAASNGSRG